jgi:ketosteroid isomerase-like protein
MEDLMRIVIEAYFKAYELKDLAALSELLADDVTLKDWEISVTGKEDVLAKAGELFQAFDTIIFKDLIIYQDGGTFWCEFELPLPDGGSIHVVDKIVVGENNLIISIEAFKQ